MDAWCHPAIRATRRPTKDLLVGTLNQNNYSVRLDLNTFLNVQDSVLYLECVAKSTPLSKDSKESVFEVSDVLIFAELMENLTSCLFADRRSFGEGARREEKELLKKKRRTRKKK